MYGCDGDQSRHLSCHREIDQNRALRGGVKLFQKQLCPDAGKDRSELLQRCFSVDKVVV
jgi:hypothetical protein